MESQESANPVEPVAEPVADEAGEPDLEPAVEPAPAPAAVLRAEHVGVRRGRTWMLAPTTVEVAAGELVIVHGDPGHGHTALALALAGRLVPDEGTVTLDGRADARALQSAVALVDVPGVSEPDDVNRLRTILGEELAMARRRHSRDDVRRWLDAHRLGAHADDRMEDLPTGARVAALAEVAAERPGVQFLVLTLPETRGGVPEDWLPGLTGLTNEGFGVLVTTSDGVARHLPHAKVRLGNAAEALEAVGQGDVA
jgi:ABC-type transport system involved in cytochrome c biogenesis ATPase subunit